MSPVRLTKMDELNYVIQQHDTQQFKYLMQHNHVPYRVAVFKAIESGSTQLFKLATEHHPHPDADTELQCLHAAFRGYLDIYKNIYFHQDTEEFNPYVDNMYLVHGRLDKVNLIEINMHDLLSPNTIPISVCDYLVQQAPNNTCLMTGVLMAYCVHNKGYARLKNNRHVFIMEIMLQLATQNDNQRLKQFLVDHFKYSGQYTASNYSYNNRSESFLKARRYARGESLNMFDHYLTKSPVNINKRLKVKGENLKEIHPDNLCLSVEMFDWHYLVEENHTDDYFDQVIDQVNYLIDEEILFKMSPR